MGADCTFLLFSCTVLGGLQAFCAGRLKVDEDFPGTVSADTDRQGIGKCGNLGGLFFRDAECAGKEPHDATLGRHRGGISFLIVDTMLAPGLQGSFETKNQDGHRIFLPLDGL